MFLKIYDIRRRVQVKLFWNESIWITDRLNLFYLSICCFLFVFELLLSLVSAFKVETLQINVYSKIGFTLKDRCQYSVNTIQLFKRKTETSLINRVSSTNFQHIVDWKHPCTRLLMCKLTTSRNIRYKFERARVHPIQVYSSACIHPSTTELWLIWVIQGTLIKPITYAWQVYSPWRERKNGYEQQVELRICWVY